MKTLAHQLRTLRWLLQYCKRLHPGFRVAIAGMPWYMYQIKILNFIKKEKSIVLSGIELYEMR